MNNDTIAASRGDIRVEGSAVGSALVTGNGNIVTIVYATDVLRARSFGENPYRGLGAFDEASSHLFFGRERVVEAITQRLARLTAPTAAVGTTRLLAIMGPSGCGKSSVARAGVIPALAQAEQGWLRKPQVAILRPGPSPIDALADALARLKTGEPNPDEERRQLVTLLRESSATGSFDAVSRIRREAPEGLLIILVDQFEETYTLCRPLDPNNDVQVQRAKVERDAFVTTLLNAAAEPSDSTCVLITVRSDFYGALAEHPDLSSAVARSNEIVPAMSRDDLRRAITEPARVEGHPIDAPTVERILDQAAGEIAALPLVQFTLDRIWERMRDNVPPGDTLTALGGIGGALASRADDLFDHSYNQTIVKRALLATVQFGDEAAHDTRRRAWLEEVVPANLSEGRVRDALEPFVEARLLAIGAIKDKIWLELPHETLIKHWKRLQDWVLLEREELRFLRKFREAAEEWSKGQGELWRGLNLQQLNALPPQRRDEMTAAEHRFWRRSAEASRLRKYGIRLIVASGVLIAAVIGAVISLDRLKENSSRTGAFANKELAAGQANIERRFLNPEPSRPVIIVALSGSGSRSAAFARSILAELRDTSYDIAERHYRLIDDVRIISSVSGASVTAAWFGLTGTEKLDDLVTSFLSRDNMASLRLNRGGLIEYTYQLFTTQRLDRLLDSQLFKGQSFLELNQPGKPFVILNATDIAHGFTFPFTPRRFDDICSSFDDLPVSTAVAASAAFPVLQTPVSFQNFSVGCSGLLRNGNWVQIDLSNPYTPHLNMTEYRDARYTNDLRHGPNPSRDIEFVHLLDGGLADNLGIGSLRAALVAPYDDAGVLRAILEGKIRSLVIVVATSGSDIANVIDRTPSIGPLDYDVASITNTARTETALSGLLNELATAAANSGGRAGLKVYGVSIDFDQIPADTQDHRNLRDAAKRLPTSWTLTPPQLELAEQTGRFLLRRDPCYRALLADLHASQPPIADEAAPLVVPCTTTKIDTEMRAPPKRSRQGNSPRIRPSVTVQ